MSRQILFCVESNNKARTDYQYIRRHASCVKYGKVCNE